MSILRPFVTDAGEIVVADTGGYFAGADAESVLAELGALKDGGAIPLIPQSFGAAADGKTFADGVMTTGSNVLSSASYTFTSADIGKHIVVNGAGAAAGAGTAGGFLVSTITGVSSGDALLADNAAADVTGVAGAAAYAAGGFVFGTDDTVALQAWLDELGTSYPISRVGFVPLGMYLFSQIVIPPRAVIRGAGWGNYGNLYGYGFAQTTNTLLHQIGGADKDAIIFDRTSVGVDYVLADLADFLVEQNLANTLGSGIVCRDPDGTALATTDGFRMHNVMCSGFAEDNFIINGAVPAQDIDCRGMFAVGAGLRYVSKTNDQGFGLKFSGDANGAGAVYVKGQGLGGTGWFDLTVKSEKAANVYRPLGLLQENAVVLEDLRDVPVAVKVSHVSSVFNGGVPEGCGPAILVRSTGAQFVPRVKWEAKVRVKVGETNPAVPPAVLYDETYNYTVPTKFTRGQYSRGDDQIDFGNGDAAQHRVIGGAYDYFGVGGLGETVGLQLIGNKPVLSFWERDGTAGRRGYAWYADGDALYLVTQKDDGTVDEIIQKVARPTSPGGSVTTLRQLMGLAPVAFPGAVAMLRSGRYHFCNPSASSSSQQPTNDMLYVMPFPVPRDVTPTRIGAEIVTGGSVGATLRLVIYADDGSGGPGALVLDSAVDGSASTVLNNGLIDATNASTQEITISKALTAGLYWAGGVVQGAPATRPYVRCVTSGTFGLGAATMAAMGAAASPVAYDQASVSGAPPATFTIAAAPQGLCPRVFVCVA